MIWALIPRWAYVVAAALVVVVAAYYTGRTLGHSQGYERHVAETAAATKRAEMERKGDDAKLKRMSDFDLCIAGLRGNGMPVDACEQLRGVRED